MMVITTAMNCGDDILNEDNVHQMVTVKHSKPTDIK